MYQGGYGQQPGYGQQLQGMMRPGMANGMSKPGLGPPPPQQQQYVQRNQQFDSFDNRVPSNLRGQQQVMNQQQHQQARRGMSSSITFG